MITAYRQSLDSRKAPTRMRPAFMLCVIIVSASVSLHASPVNTGEVLVIVNGDTISADDLNALLVDVHTSMQSNERLDFDYRRLLDKLVNDRLIIQEALALGIDQEDRLLERLDSIRTRKAVALYAGESYHPDLTIADDEILAYFEKYYSRMQVRSIAVATKEAAASLAEKIRSGASMDSLARDTSLDMHRYRGGLHNFKYYGDVENTIRDVAERLQPGEVSAPFPYRQVWSIIRLEQRASADPGELDTHRKRIASALRYLRNQLKWESFIDSLVETYPLAIDSTGLNDIRADSAKLFSRDFMHGTDRVLFQTGSGRTVTDDEFRRMISRTAMTMATAPFDSMMELAHRDVLKKLVLWSAARRGGYFDRPEVVRYRQQQRDSMLVETYLQETVVSRITFKREEFDDYYREHIDQFRYPNKYQFDRILVESEDTAREIYGRLADGADFYFVGRRYGARLSTPSEATEWLSLASFSDSIRNEIGALRTGQSTAPHRTTEGWLILRLKAQKEGEPRPMEEVEMRIREVMFQRHFSELLDETLDILKENSIIEYNEQAIERYFSADG